MMNKTELKCLFLEVHWQLTPQYITVSVMSCVISSIFALTSVLGNGTIMFVIWKDKDLHSPSHTLLFCLAVADALVGLISQPCFVAFKTAELLRQYDVYCNLRLIQFFFGWIIGSVSYLILSAISIDRLLALSLHLRYNSIVTVPRVTKLVIVIWLLISIVTASKIWLGDKWIVFPIVINVFSIFTTAFCTYKIFHIARKHLKKIHKETQATIHMNSRAAEVAKCQNSALTVIYLYVVMLLFYLPFLAVMIIENVRGVTSSVQLSYDLVTTFVFLNSSVNPIIYCWRMKQVRSAVKKCFRCGLT
ncbi:melanocyte-stimulating hormone receptor-like [Acropora millepora]|uniref:melanocyte-stimulating hormone receptor-like n=1 Tax=Acropora millepora TaxID=45264 RepID=UPI001CF5E485|nr:melanocyte-stimulating hormone receptor-like [Acropora millepora]